VARKVIENSRKGFSSQESEGGIYESELVARKGKEESIEANQKPGK
jgi:hypothetical protein